MSSPVVTVLSSAVGAVLAEVVKAPLTVMQQRSATTGSGSSAIVYGVRELVGIGDSPAHGADGRASSLVSRPGTVTLDALQRHQHMRRVEVGSSVRIGGSPEDKGSGGVA